MIEIKKEQADSLYSEIKDIILSEKDGLGGYYEKKQHYLYEQEASPELRANFYNERGSLEFQNIAGEIITIEINRWHAHKHNGWSGLNGVPCLSAVICIGEKDEQKKIWELKVGSGTMYYKAEVTDFGISKDALLQKVKATSDLPGELQNECFEGKRNELIKPLQKVLKPKE